MCAGRITIVSTTLEPSATAATIGSAESRSPMRPAMYASGRKARMIVVALAMIGQKTLLVPSIAARSGFRPPAERWMMMSATTIASSASMPTTMSRPNIVTRLSVTPSAHMVSAVHPIDTKMPDMTHHAARTFMKRIMTIRTSAEPCSASLVRRSRRPSMMRARSLCAAIEQLSGAFAFDCSPSA